MRSLTGRLVATAVALVLLVSLAVVGLSAFALHDHLTERLDERVAATAGRLDDPGGQAGDPGRREDPGTGAEPGPGGPGFGPAADVRRYGDASGTLHAGLGATAAQGSIVSEDGTPDTLGSADLTALRGVPVDGEVHKVSLPEAGGYRVIATEDADVTWLSGLPTAPTDAAVATLAVTGAALAGAGVLAAGVGGTVVVRRQLRPLREVAATAHEVSELPLASGEITLSARVPDHLTDERTEVGQVGAALNRVLAHVAGSLEARHRSEQQVRQFVADASHELRTPLATIAGYAELARRRPEDTAAVRAALAKVEAESGVMTALVEDLLLLARLDAGRPLERAPVDLSRILVEAVSDARVLAPGHRWRLDLPAEPVEVVGDAQRLRQVVTNLIANARSHTPGGTTVTVTAGPGQLQVRDDGPGFPPGLAATAFERFARGDAARTRGTGPGTGLGLALVQAIVTAHGGSVSLRSGPGDTALTVRLPGG